MIKYSNKLLQYFCTALAFLIASGSAQAQIVVTLADPQWNFVLKNDGIGDRRGRLAREENEFLQQIQPLLADNDYAGVVAAFAQRDESTLTPALSELYGQVLLSTKKIDDAERVLSNALKKMPGLSMAHRSLSMVYMIKQDFPQARKHLVRSIELGVADAQLYGQLAYVNLHLNRPVTAIAAYQNALMLEPDNSQWYQGLLFAFIQSDALPQASNLIDEMLEKDAQNPRLWLQRGQIAMKKNNETAAISSIETALQLGESRIENISMLARLHLRAGSAERAVGLVSDHAKDFLQDDDSGEWSTLDSLANWLVAKQDWTQLRQLLQALDKTNAKLTSAQTASLNVARAQLSMASNEYDSATRYLRSAVSAAPDNGEALLTLAGLYRQQKNVEQAKMYYLRAEALSDYKERAMLGRAQIAINQQDYDDALGLLRKIYNANPGRNDLLGNIQSLENLVRNAS